MILLLIQYIYLLFVGSFIIPGSQCSNYCCWQAREGQTFCIEETWQKRTRELGIRCVWTCVWSSRTGTCYRVFCSGNRWTLGISDRTSASSFTASSSLVYIFKLKVYYILIKFKLFNFILNKLKLIKIKSKLKVYYI